MNAAETRELTLAAYHEAGHALAHLDLDLPLYDARIWLTRPWRGQRHGDGEVRITRAGGAWNLPIGPYLLACLAGPEAEARCVAEDGRGLRVARRDAYHYSRDGDMARVHAKLRDAPFGLSEVEAETQEMVGRLWRQVQAVAGALVERGRLTARDIRAVAR